MHLPIMDDQIVTNAVNNLKEDEELDGMSLRDVRTYVSRTDQANRLNFSSDGIDQGEEEGIEHIQVEYEILVPMFCNIDRIVKFNHRIEK